MPDLLALGWSGALGNSLAAVTDGGKGACNDCAGTWPNVPSVVDQPGIGRAFKVSAVAGCGHVKMPALFPPLAPKTVWGSEFELVVEGPHATRWHPICLNPVGVIQAELVQIFPVANSRWEFGFRVAGGPDSNPWKPRKSGRVITFDYLRRLRYRWELIGLANGDVEFRPALFDATTGERLDDDWYHQNTRTTLRAWYAAGNSFRFSDAALARTPSFGQGESQQLGGAYYIANARFWSRVTDVSVVSISGARRTGWQVTRDGAAVTDLRSIRVHVPVRSAPVVTMDTVGGGVEQFTTERVAFPELVMLDETPVAP